MMKSIKSKSGFTILEVLAATVIFSMAVYTIVDSQRGSMRNMVQSENYFLATNLARSKLTELELKYQRTLNKDGVTSTLGEETGTFEKPYESFKWKVSVKEGEIDLTPDTLVKFMISQNLSKEDAVQLIEEQKLVLTNLNKAIKENFIEMRLDVMWDYSGRTHSIPIVTHIIPLKPKIQLTTTIEN